MRKKCEAPEAVGGVRAAPDDGFYFVLQPFFDIRTGEVQERRRWPECGARGEEDHARNLSPLWKRWAISQAGFLIYDKVCRYMAEREAAGAFQLLQHP